MRRRACPPPLAWTPPRASARCEVLTHGFAEDRLTEAELEERLDGVYRATTAPRWTR